MILLTFIIFIFVSKCDSQALYTRDFNFRVNAGDRTCFYEVGKGGQMLEVYYQVLDGQHGDLDISLDVIDPTGQLLVSDYKKSQNAIIKDLETDGEYAFCLDNTFSVMNAKLVFLYIMFEDQSFDNSHQATVTTDFNESEGKQEITHWMGTYDNGENYYIDIEYIADSLSRTLKHVVKGRHLLDLYAAVKSRDTHIAFKDTHIVDMWSGFQITFMCLVGSLQVFMIKKLFSSRYYIHK